MKKFVLFVMLLVPIISSAQILLEGNKEGNYRVKEDVQEWADSRITAEPEAIKYIDKFSQAIQNPDEPILVEQSEEIVKLKLVFKKLVEVKQNFIVYKEKENNISFSTETKEEKKSSYLILFSIASILLMVSSNMFFKREKKNSAAFATTIAAFAAAIAVAFAAFAAAFAAFAAAIAAAFATAIVVSIAAFGDRNKEENYKIVSVIFYIFMAIHIVLLFI